LVIDLTQEAGFPLHLDTQALDVAFGDGISFERQPRLVDELREVLYEPDSLPSDMPFYWNYKLVHAGEADQLFQTARLTFGLVLLPPLKAGVEFVKTHGHYHACMPGSQIGYPEVYTHYYGELFLLMQRRKRGKAIELDDCVLYRMIPGKSIMVPPGYAHILINPSLEPGLMAGLYSLDAIHDYGPIRETAGGAYYLIEAAGRQQFLPNPLYTKNPPLRMISDLSGTRFSPPDCNQPLWRSYIADPQRYAFITNTVQASRQFLPEDQRL
jgi:glucose-6-phosphate isomerase